MDLSMISKKVLSKTYKNKSEVNCFFIIYFNLTSSANKNRTVLQVRYVMMFCLISVKSHT